MKAVAILILALNAAFLCGCNRPSAQNVSPTESAAPAAPEPKTAAAAATPLPAPAPQLAPPGVFYLIETARVETDSGITGLPPGTGVKLLHDDVYQTPAGEAHLRPEQVTNDMTLARQVMTADRNLQAALKASMASQAKAAEQANATEMANLAAAQNAATQTAKNDAASLRVATLENERQAIDEKLLVLRQKQSAENYRQNVQGHIIASHTADEAKALIDRRAAIENEILRLRH